MDEFRTIIPIRVVVAVLIFFGSFTSNMLRVNISIVLIYISKYSNHSIENDPNCRKDLSLFIPQNWSGSSRSMYSVTTEWKPLNPIMVATLLSAYSWGYSFTILLSEPLADKIGVVRIVGYSTLMSAILTVLSPLAYEAGVFVLIAVRFLIGFLSGFVFPLLHILILKWSPMNERNAFSFTLYGASVGIIVTFPLSGYILTRLSWEWINYILGTFAIIWATIWLIFVTDLPIQHGHISRHELQMIEFRRISLASRRRRKRVPWRKIMKSVPIWALFILLWGNSWNLSFYVDYMPLYFFSMLNYDVVLASSLASLPMVARMLFSWVCLPLAKCCALRNCFSSVGNIRKSFTFLSHILPAVIQLGLINLLFCNQVASTIVPIVVLGLNGAIIAGGTLNTVDLTPHFSANVYNAMQALLCFAGICMPYVVGIILLSFDNHVKGWMILLGVNSCIWLIGGIVFLIFGSGSAQEWDVYVLRGTISLEDGVEDIEMY